MAYQFIVWYFFDAPKGILKAWKNFLVFNFNYFSIFLLLRSLVSPWRRYSYGYGRGFYLNRYLYAFCFNMVSRGVGATVRIIAIIAGLLCEALIFILGIIAFLGWLVLPIILLGGLYLGLKLLL